MRRKRYLIRAKTWLMDYAYLVTLGAVIAIIVAGAIYTQQIRIKHEAEIAAAAQAHELQSEKTPVPTISPLPTIAPVQVRYTALHERREGTVWPLGGRVLRGYDQTEGVYWEALESIRVHHGLDIEGKEGEAVLCAADGVVSSVVRDVMWGLRVTVEQMDGRRAVYAGLRAAAVSSGQSATRGQEIGWLLDRIPCEAEMPAHLHMELYRDNKAQDPEGMLPER